MSNETKKARMDFVCALFAMILGEAFAVIAVWPMMAEVPMVTRSFLTYGFGLMLGAIFFLIGMPVVEGLKVLIFWILRRKYGARPERPPES